MHKIQENIVVLQCNFESGRVLHFDKQPDNNWIQFNKINERVLRFRFINENEFFWVYDCNLIIGYVHVHI